MTPSPLRATLLGVAVVACLATSSAAEATWRVVDQHQTIVTVAGANDLVLTTHIDAEGADFWTSDQLVVEAATAGIGGTLTLTVTVDGRSASDTIALNGGTETTASVRLNDIVPSCVDTGPACRTDIDVSFTTNIPVDVDVNGTITVYGGDYGSTPTVTLQ